MGDNKTSEKEEKSIDQKNKSGNSLKHLNEKKENITDTQSKEKLIEGDSGSGSSLKPLRPVKSSENIAILNKLSGSSEEEMQKIHEEVPEHVKAEVDSEAKVETFFEKPNIDDDKKSAEKIDTKSEIPQLETSTFNM